MLNHTASAGGATTAWWAVAGGGDHLDIMDLALTGPVASHRALTSGEVLYADTAQTFAERQIFAINYYIETAPMRRAILKSLTR